MEGHQGDDVESSGPSYFWGGGIDEEEEEEEEAEVGVDCFTLSFPTQIVREQGVRSKNARSAPVVGTWHLAPGTARLGGGKKRMAKMETGGWLVGRLAAMNPCRGDAYYFDLVSWKQDLYR